MNARSRLIAAIRSEVVGPEMPGPDARILSIANDGTAATPPEGAGLLFWLPDPGRIAQEVVHYSKERPGRKYGAGRLWPQDHVRESVGKEPLEDRVGYDPQPAGADDGATGEVVAGEEDDGDSPMVTVGDEDLDLSNADVLHPASLAVTVCVRLEDSGRLLVRLPRNKRFDWQTREEPPFELNGRYRKTQLEGVAEWSRTGWRRQPAVPDDCAVHFAAAELRTLRLLSKFVPVETGNPLKLLVEAVARVQRDGSLLVTVVLRNRTPARSREEIEAGSLFQTHFEVSAEGGHLLPYPESPVPFSRLDPDEQSLAMLYRDDETWAIGHGCAAGWEIDAATGTATSIFADVLPAVELPSMTPDITLPDGSPLDLAMNDLARLSDDGTGAGWVSLQILVDGYARWLTGQRARLVGTLSGELKEVGERHLTECEDVLDRMRAGLSLLRDDALVREAFKLANVSMLLQQIASKQLKPRRMQVSGRDRTPLPISPLSSPLEILESGAVDGRIGRWRAFQAGFLLMSLVGVTDPASPDRGVVDLIWFPTGGGKTEAYLGAMAIYMFHQRILMRSEDGSVLRRDGTNVLMRYTLRMLTTQQFQRAASLICAMEVLRRETHTSSPIPGGRFSLGLWLGRDGSPNKIDDADTAVRDYKREPRKNGNPMVLTECPWCRCGIGAVESDGRASGPVPVVGITSVGNEGPLLHCPDGACHFGGPPHRKADWLPVEVIDERIYANPPSLVISTADKFAIMAYRPHAGAILGREISGSEVAVVRQPPGLIIQDELHLIAGPLGTIYGLYETVIEDLCSVPDGSRVLPPKRIASTATIRGAEDQVRGIFGVAATSSSKKRLQLFPSPGLDMGDSFFGRYARNADGSLMHGRLYLGLHGNEFSSVLTTQVRAYSRMLFAVSQLLPADRDPWWTLLAFYNSIRELGGAHTLVQSDIRARLKFIADRHGVVASDRRHLSPPHELTSRRTQAEIVGMIDALSQPYTPEAGRAIDICLASNIIEVGVDIDRLSLMTVVGQPKTTAQYIQVTGRVGRRWQERPGLILTLYNPMRSRDRSHYEQFHSYHRRLYERVEPTTATPFSPSAIDRAAAGAALLWARQHLAADHPSLDRYGQHIDAAFELLAARCRSVERTESLPASLGRLEFIRNALRDKLAAEPQQWESFPPEPEGEYLMLWPGQAYTPTQRHFGVVVPNAMRQVDRSAELDITDRYATAIPQGAGATA